MSTEKVQVNKHWRRGDKNMKNCRKASESMEEISPGKSFKNSQSKHFFIKQTASLGQRPPETETLWLGAMVEECHGGKPEVREEKVV